VNRTSQRFPIRFGRFNAALMTLFGMAPNRSFIEVTDDEVLVRMGWAFSATLPRSSIADIRRRGYVWWAFGVHSLGWTTSRWVVNGSGHGMVEVVLDPPARGRTLGKSIQLREIWLSLDDPDEFVAAVRR
jgi:hypothetical protein